MKNMGSHVTGCIYFRPHSCADNSYKVNGRDGWKIVPPYPTPPENLNFLVKYQTEIFSTKKPQYFFYSKWFYSCSWEL